MKSALLLYPHQLYRLEDLPKVETVVMVEDPLYFGMDQEFPLRLHKQKLVLHRASMRRYVEEVLWPADFKVEYIGLDVFMNSSDVLDRVKKVEQLYVIDPTDELLSKRLLAARRERDDLPNITFLASPNFYLKEQEIRDYFSAHKKPEFADFYQWQRERFNVLIDESYKPVGGKWAFDTEHHRKLPEDAPLPSFGVFGDNKYVTDAIKWVEEHFPDNPGSTDFMWPTNHVEAKKWLDDFVAHRLDNFAIYHNTIDPRAPWLFHSLLASCLHTGLLKPQEIFHAALQRHQANPVDLESLELFVRQVLGWREFTRGHYLHDAHALRSQNTYNHHRKLTSAWYAGSTGIPPLDDLIKKLQAHGYGHGNELRLVAGNLMILCEIHPQHMYRWFSELCLDSFDWTLVPNVYGMNLFNPLAANNILAIAPSESVLEVSNYQRDVWSDIWDGLYWRFVEKHAESFKKDKNLRVLVHRLEKLEPDYKRIIHYRAEDFLTGHTAA
jgi:deoxyribodipyrimidine photolyase-related protein